MFKNGDFSLEIQCRSGRTLTSRTDENIEKIQKTINARRKRFVSKSLENETIAAAFVSRSPIDA